MQHLNHLNINQLIHLSTCSVFSEESNQTNSPDPTNLYGLSKYVSEKIVRFCLEKRKLPKYKEIQWKLIKIKANHRKRLKFSDFSGKS